jgi:peroxiredoxin
VVAVSVDQAVTSAALRDFVTRRKLAFDVWHDPEDRASRILGVAALPVTLLVDRTGIVSWRRDGAVTADDAELERAIQAALRPR